MAVLTFAGAFLVAVAFFSVSFFATGLASFFPSLTVPEAPGTELTHYKPLMVVHVRGPARLDKRVEDRRVSGEVCE